MRLLDEQGHAEPTRGVSAPEADKIWVAAMLPEGLLTLDRVSGTIARLRDPTGTVRVDVQVPADRSIDIVEFSPDRKRLAIVWRGPGHFSVRVYDLSGEGTGPYDRTSSCAEVWSLVFQPRWHAIGITASDDARTAHGCGMRRSRAGR